MNSKSLFNPKDVREYREYLLKEQGGKDALTNLPLDSKDAVLDHNHETEVVRGAIHRQVNAALGKIENIWKRYLSTWYPGTLTDFLENARIYIDSDGFIQNNTVYHPNWIKRCVRDFKRQDAMRQRMLLKEMLENEDFQMPSNAEGRVKIFRATILKKRMSYNLVKDYLEV